MSAATKEARWLEPAAPFNFPGGLNMQYQGGVLLQSSGPQTIGSSSTQTPVTFATAIFDDLGAWSAGSPSQFTVPAGITRMALFMKGSWNAATIIGTNDSFGQISPYKNGIAFTPALGALAEFIPTATYAGAHYLTLSAKSYIIPVTPGDVWTLQCSQQTGQNQTFTASTFGADFYA
jgi:hypothetical protein